MSRMDAVVVGSGPNGLAAAITIAQTGRSVVLFEGAESIGGGCRSAELTLPGFVHDVCSAIHPFAIVSPAFRSLPLEAHGLAWVEPPIMAAHPLDDGHAAVVYRSVESTARALGDDGQAYADLFGPLLESWPRIEDAVLGPLRWPTHPLALARFGLRALQSAEGLARRTFSSATARALLAGMAAHGMLPLDKPLTAGIGLTLTLMAHVAGWCFPRGGAQRLTDALAAHFRLLRGEIVAAHPIRSMRDVPPARAVLFDLSPRPLLQIAGELFPASYRHALQRYRYGMGVFKVDWALADPIPWSAPRCRESATVHLGGTLEEIARAEREPWNGRPSDRPFVLLAQHTPFDSTRAPAGRHTAWAYCHVPSGSPADMLPQIEDQIERFAPGFRARVLARSVMRPADLEHMNPNLVGGDIAAGVSDLRQFFTRPTWRTYSTPARGIYICSAATPPGVGVHGMGGYFAAQRALKEVLQD
jgi:phytoene dehydrogenase-like protein